MEVIPTPEEAAIIEKDRRVDKAHREMIKEVGAKGITWYFVIKKNAKRYIEKYKNDWNEAGWDVSYELRKPKCDFNDYQFNKDYYDKYIVKIKPKS